MKRICTLAALIWTATTYGQSHYQVDIDLTNSKDDQLEVTITLPEIQEDTIEFHLPKIVPGTYSISDFGRFVKSFAAINENGDTINTEKISTNRWQINGQPSKVIYWIGDTFDKTEGYNDNIIFEPGGTSFEADRDVFVLNPFGLVGYLDGYSLIPFKMNVKHSESTYGATALARDSATATVDYFTAQNYNFLADGPIMYNEPDTIVKEIAGADILISVFSPSKKVTAVDILANIEDLMVAQSNYLGGELPVDRYAYLIYLMDYPSMSKAMGALEHSYSSFYTLPERVATRLPQFVRDVAAHEFLHIVTPLNIHSEQIHNFNYIEPEMSRHLWLYEGVTEYSSMHVQVRENLYDGEEFLNAIQGKIASAKNYSLVSFTEMSERILEPEFEPMYGNVYEKGALIGMCLDIQLIHYSDGTMDLPSLMKDLSSTYGPNQAFDDKTFIQELTDKTYPEIGEFFAKHVEGDEELPLSKYLAMAGVGSTKDQKIEVASLGNVEIDLNQDNQIILAGTDNMDEFGKAMGFESGDVLFKINGVEITLENAMTVIQDFQTETSAGDKVKFEVLRTVKGKEKVIKLKAKAVTFESMAKEKLEFISNATEKQLATRQVWLEGINKK